MAVELTYILTLKEAGDKTFTMPAGFEESVEIHCWGAGGGGSLRVSGGGGGYASTVARIPAGSVVRLQIGQPGANGGRGNNPPSPGGSHPSYTRYRGGSAGSSRDEDADMGSGGGGGGASAVVIDNSPVCVGAGGGGAGGPGDDSRSGTPGNPGGVYPGSSTNVYPVTLSYAWNSFMNSYAVWGGGQDYTVILNFPVTGTYTFNYAVDNYGQVFLDGSAIITLSGTVTSHFNTTTTYTATVSAGNHTVRVTGVNTGGPAGVAAQILKPDTTELWNTRALTVTSGLTGTSDGGNSVNAWASGGGGGGGYFGGQAGTSYGDDAGNAPGGNGGQNYGAIIESGSGATGAGKSTTYYPRTLVASPIGNAGYPGYIVMIFTRRPGLQIKNPNGSGNWVIVQNSYVKTASQSVTLSQTDAPGTVSFNSVGVSTFTVPQNVYSLTISASGGGGGGGGADGGSNYNGGGGGGGGADIISQTFAVTPGQVLDITVGAGGGGGGGPYGTGGTGQATTVTGTGISFSAAGGAGGTGGSNSGTGFGGLGANGANYTSSYRVNAGGTSTNDGSNGGAGGVGKNAAGQAGKTGKVAISYTPTPTIITTVTGGWKEIQNIYVKNGGVWKSISQQNDIVIYNYS